MPVIGKKIGKRNRKPRKRNSLKQRKVHSKLNTFCKNLKYRKARGIAKVDIELDHDQEQEAKDPQEKGGCKSN